MICEMALLPIITYPAPLLRKPTEPVSRYDDTLMRLIRDMSETLYAAPGLGLAANQVNNPQRMFVYDVTWREGKRDLITVVNPEIIYSEGEIVEEEGCLSLPEYREFVRRAEKIVLRGYDQKGREIKIEAEDILARVIQHEMDHLDGKLLVDRLSGLKRQLFLRKMKKREKLRAG
jgi:peptide deformylase